MASRAIVNQTKLKISVAIRKINKPSNDSVAVGVVTEENSQMA